MIVIYIKKSWITGAYFLKHIIKNEWKGQKIKVLVKPNKKILRDSDIIIPMGIDPQKDLVNNKYFNKVLLCNNVDIYDTLDDKIKFYKFVQDYDLLKNTYVKLIKTYNKYYNGKNKYGTFLIKHKDGAASSSNYEKKGYIYDLINKYKKHQVQKLIDVKQIHGINCLCADGTIVSALHFMTPNSINSKFYYRNDNVQFIKPMTEPFITVCENIVRNSNYTGLLEIEFLQSKSGKIYLMECNPRISGFIRCVLDDGTSPYVENLIKPYIDIIKGNKINVVPYDKTYNLEYNGSWKPSYKISGGLVKFK